MEHFPIQNEQWINQWWIGGLQAQDTAPVSTKEILTHKTTKMQTKKQESKQTNNQTKIFDC